MISDNHCDSHRSLNLFDESCTDYDLGSPKLYAEATCVVLAFLPDFTSSRRSSLSVGWTLREVISGTWSRMCWFYERAFFVLSISLLA